MTDGWLANGYQTSDTVYVGLRDSRCQGSKPDSDPCPFQARFFMVNDEGAVVGLCGHHVNDLWLDELHDEIDAGFDVYDALRETCDADLSTVNSAEDGVDPECGAQASILLVSVRDGTTHTACRRHAMTTWFRDLRIERQQESADAAEA